MAYPAWVKEEADLMAHGDRAWIEQCHVCERDFETAIASYWCDDCYEQICREDDEGVNQDLSACAECGEPVYGWDWRTGSTPMHGLCAEVRFGDAA